MTNESPRTMTIAEAAAYTGKSKKAIRSACDRGALPHTLAQGVRRIPVQYLEPGPQAAPVGQGQPQGQPREAAALDQLVERLEELASENGRLRALSEVSESTEKALKDRLAQVEAENLSLSLQLVEFQAASSGSWFSRRKQKRAGAISEGAPKAL